uniref:Uncharacterized protein n=1 Tax=Esox lucius TaxID=8010 RepID=A0A3P8Z128_ESOLU
MQFSFFIFFLPVLPDPPLPLPSLRLFVPPLRLVSAALWQVVQQGDIMDYGLVEEFVTTVLEVVPDMMSYREKVQLVMGLRAKLVLELCRSEQSADPETIQPHLSRIRTFIMTHTEKEVSAKVEASETKFLELVQTLLVNPKMREHFFQEVFPVEFGPMYDTALQTLMWEFLSRLEKLLPTPTFQETASWLRPAPSLLKECAQTVTQPHPLKTLLLHHRCHIQPSCVNDHILSSLSQILPEKVEIDIYGIRSESTYSPRNCPIHNNDGATVKEENNVENELGMNSDIVIKKPVEITNVRTEDLEEKHYEEILNDVSQTSSTTHIVGRSWSLEETKALITIWSNEEILQKFGKWYRNKHVYTEISQLLNDLGFKRTWKQCQTKIKDMKYSYRRDLEEDYGEMLKNHKPADLANVGIEDVSQTSSTTHIVGRSWSLEETKALITIWSNEEILQKFGKWYRNKHVYTEISQLLNDLGFKRTWKQCQTKIKDMKYSYRRALKNPSSSSPVSFSFFSELHTFLSRMPYLPGSKETGQVSDGEEMSMDQDEGPSVDVYLEERAQNCNWTTDETKMLISLWSNKPILQELQHSYRKHHVYLNISKQLNNLGYKKTWKQCQTKIKDMKYSYRRALRNPKSSGRVPCSFYSELHAFLSVMPDSKERGVVSGGEVMSLDQNDNVDVNSEDSPLEEMASGKETRKTLRAEQTEEIKGDGAFHSPRSDEVICMERETNTCQQVAEDFKPLDQHNYINTMAFADDVGWTWSPEETKALISVWSDEQILLKMEQTYRNKHVYSEISERLKDLGVKRTWKQCQNKMKALKWRYRETLRNPSSRPCPFFSKLHKFLAAMPDMPESKETGDEEDEEDDDDMSETSSMTTDDVGWTCWTPGETKALISVWSDEHILHKMEQTYRKKHVYTEISECLKELGVKRTWKQCHNKVKALKWRYRETLRNASSRPCPFFSELHKFLAPVPDTPQHKEPGKVSGDVRFWDQDERPHAFVDSEEPSHEEMASRKVTQSSLGAERTEQKNSEGAFHSLPSDSRMKIQRKTSHRKNMAEDMSSTSSDNDTRTWTLEGTKALISVWSNGQVLQMMEQSYRKKHAYSEVSERLKNLGIRRTWKQCQSKIKHMKHSYRQALRNPSSGRATCPFFPELHAFLSSMPDMPESKETAVVSDGDLLSSDQDEGPSVDVQLDPLREDIGLKNVTQKTLTAEQTEDTKGDDSDSRINLGRKREVEDMSDLELQPVVLLTQLDDNGLLTGE